MTRLAWVDVFASGPMSGNPLAVVLDVDGWPASRMQALAAELGLSETAFILSANGRAGGRLRIFTPQRELPVAGHPVVGAAWVLKAAGTSAAPWPPARVWSTGIPQLMLPVEDVAALDSARPDEDALIALGERLRVRVRHFAPRLAAGSSSWSARATAPAAARWPCGCGARRAARAGCRWAAAWCRCSRAGCSGCDPAPTGWVPVSSVS